ncbi:MAG: M48 family metalloprotease [Syntrophales bacterium]|nr:M48 family metalloprotease [Syntrophales bacterium]MCK9528325.1 M48 family metalloprotease [Syntrophales bacterium]MDX9922164.1 M48 family metalloprotease [Syntrophales bacterium]
MTATRPWKPLRALLSLFVAASLLLALPSPSQATFTYDDERRVGKELYDKIKEAGLLLTDDPLVDYVNEIGERLIRQDNRYPLDFTFSVIQSSGINAFATPGGYVYVFTGLVKLAENESQLAGVLAHEIAHVKARHIAQMVSASKRLGVASLAAVLAGALIGGGEAAAALMGLTSAASATMTLKYSREHEEEADRLGMGYLVGAGYLGRSMLDFLKIMQFNQFYSNTVPSYFLTHPQTSDRIRYLTLLLETRYRQEGETEMYGGFERHKTRLYLKRQSPRDNLRYFAERIRQNPLDPEAHYGLAVSESKTGQYDAAAQSFTRALELKPEDIEIIRDFGISFFEKGDIPAALDQLGQAWNRGARDRDTLFYLGKSYEMEGDYPAALDMFRTINEINPNDSEIYYNLAMMYGKTGELGESHYYFGKYFKSTGKMSSARFHFKTALDQVPPESPRAGDIRKEMDPGES